MMNDISNLTTLFIEHQRQGSQNTGDGARRSGEKGGRPSVFETQDVVLISGQKPVSQDREIKAPPPVNGQDGHMQDASAKKAGTGLPDGGLPDGPAAEKGEGSTTGRDKLNEDEKREVEDLKKRDKEVRQHEQAHLAAGGRYAHGMSLDFQAGPDGKRYAVGGEVSIDTSPVPGDPDATIAKAQTIRRAANAPARPSAQDRQVAAAASRMENSARMEKVKETREEGGADDVSPGAAKGGSDTAEPGKADEENINTPDQAISQYGHKESEIGRVLHVTA